jgi:Family of unknown function (DUF6069)
MSVIARRLDRPPPTRSSRRRRVGAVGAATAATIGAWIIISPVAGVDLRVGSEPDIRTVGLGAVVTTVLFAALAGWVVLAALERWSTHPRRNWLAAVAAGLVLSLAGPLTAAAGTASALGLGALHVVTAATLAAVLAGSAGKP